MSFFVQFYLIIVAAFIHNILTLNYLFQKNQKRHDKCLLLVSAHHRSTCKGRLVERHAFAAGAVATFTRKKERI
jgi:hypothetical protein